LLAEPAVLPPPSVPAGSSSLAVARLPAWKLAGAPVREGAGFRLTVPYSIGNVGPGFDRFGLCLADPVDVLDVAPSDRFQFEVQGESSIPRDPEANAASVAFRALTRLAGREVAVSLRLRKGFRGGSGIGSSGASSVAGALAGALALGWRLDEPEQIRAVARAASAGEEVAAGAAHLDNALASLFGGFVFLEEVEPLSVLALTPRLGAKIVLAIPDTPLPTRESRAVLPRTIPRADAVENLSRAAALLQAVVAGDGPRVGANLGDRIAAPYRIPLVPGFAVARDAALAAGAWGVALSGSGPALFAIAPAERARRVAVGFLEGFKRAGVLAEAFVTEIGGGARLEPTAASGGSP
jgi:homoserine kinase